MYDILKPVVCCDSAVTVDHYIPVFIISIQESVYCVSEQRQSLYEVGVSEVSKGL